MNEPIVDRSVIQETTSLPDPAEIARLLAEIESLYQPGEKTITRRLTIPAIFQRETDEVFMSNYLAYILDLEKNGIGVKPLQALLSLVNVHIDEKEIGRVVIKREYEFNNPSGWIIDFIIWCGENSVIGIENKLLSPESENQTASYAAGCANEFPNITHYLIFLTPEGKPAQCDQFKPVSYRNLLAKFRDIQFPILSDIHKTVIWEDFLAHLEEYIVMAKEKLNLSGNTRLYQKHFTTLESLRKDFQQDAEEIYDYLMPKVEAKFGPGWTCTFKGSNRFQEISRDSWKTDKFRVFYQFLFDKVDLLTKEAVPFMVGVYPRKEAKAFYEWLQITYPNIREICNQKSMKAFTQEADETVSFIIARKEYPNNIENPAEIDVPLLQAVNEFDVFTEIMEDALRRYRTEVEITA